MFPSKIEYENLIYAILTKSKYLVKSTLHFYTTSATTGLLKGSLFFIDKFELRLVEVIDFAAGEILDYSYSIFQNNDKIRWYDPQPHPNEPSLAGTFSHHKHENPDIKKNRKPAPDISFDKPNLLVLIKEIELLLNT